MHESQWCTAELTETHSSLPLIHLEVWFIGVNRSLYLIQLWKRCTTSLLESQREEAVGSKSKTDLELHRIASLNYSRLTDRLVTNLDFNTSDSCACISGICETAWAKKVLKVSTAGNSTTAWSYGYLHLPLHQQVTLLCLFIRLYNWFLE